MLHNRDCFQSALVLGKIPHCFSYCYVESEFYFTFSNKINLLSLSPTPFPIFLVMVVVSFIIFSFHPFLERCIYCIPSCRNSCEMMDIIHNAPPCIILARSFMHYIATSCVPKTGRLLRLINVDHCKPLKYSFNLVVIIPYPFRTSSMYTSLFSAGNWKLSIRSFSTKVDLSYFPY